MALSDSDLTSLLAIYYFFCYLSNIIKTANGICSVGWSSTCSTYSLVVFIFFAIVATVAMLSIVWTVVRV